MSAIAPTPARWWHPLEEKKVVCTLCPRECHIPVGSRGFCFVRANVDGRLELTTYGRSSGFCIDPIEKKPLNHFLPGTPTLSFGTAGCNLGCKFCQNWDISKSREMDTLAQMALPEAIVEAAVKTGCRSLAFTYNDPVIWAEYALDIARVAHANGIKTVAVTAGYISPEARGEFYEHMDAANVDLKGFTDVFYRKLCQAQLSPILDTLKFLKRETKVWFELTNLIIPGENDSSEETKAMCDWIVENLGPDVPVHFSAFHPDFKMRQTPPTPPQTLVRARQIAVEAGIRYAYVGNVNDETNQSTYCHGCGKLLIQRDWYQLGAYRLHGNACAECGTIIPGVFDNAGPGNWGRKRQPITIGDNASRPVKVNVGPKIEFSAEEDAQLLAYARAVVEAAVRNQPVAGPDLSERLAQAPAYGLFVSLHRGMQLRSCKGNSGDPQTRALTPLKELLTTVARDAAANDPRFPRITPEELPYLGVEISLIHSPQLMTATGADRVNSVQIGTHGLVISHPNGRGLLLPHVATEAKWDAKTFLEQTCAKAGLPAHAWLDDQTQLMTFRARKFDAPAPTPELEPAELGSNALSVVVLVIHQAMGIAPQTPALPDQTQAPFLYQVHPEELGLCLLTASGVNGVAMGANSTLLSLAKSAAQSLAGALQQRGIVEPVEKMTVLWRPQVLAAADYPARHRTLIDCAALAQADGRWSLIVPQPERRSDAIAEAMAGLKITHQQWLADRAGRIRVMAFNAFHCHGQTNGTAPSQSAGAHVRPPFRAGAFYPAEVGQIIAEVDGYLRAGGAGQIPRQACRAIMLPHAGWRFCGNTMGKTLAGVKIPQTVIILGPKHTPLGPPCSVASHSAWQIPGATIPVATAIVQRLSRAVPSLQCEGEAHRQEHGAEVLLPFLLRLRPDMQIVPIALGPCGADTLTALSRELAAILNEAKAAGQEPPLLVISSDMNHFAPEPENRRRDLLAVEAMKTGDPRQLYETCQKNDISMCGLLPAIAVMQALLLQTPVIQPRLVDYSTSAAASGDTARVVGYAGVVIE